MKGKFKYKDSYTLNKDLGLTVKRARNNKDIKQIDLAESIGVGRSYISELESGKRNPTVESLVLIAISLEIPLSVLFNDAESI